MSHFSSTPWTRTIRVFLYHWNPVLAHHWQSQQQSRRGLAILGVEAVVGLNLPCQNLRSRQAQSQPEGSQPGPVQADLAERDQLQQHSPPFKPREATHSVHRMRDTGTLNGRMCRPHLPWSPMTRTMDMDKGTFREKDGATGELILLAAANGISISVFHVDSETSLPEALQFQAKFDRTKHPKVSGGKTGVKETSSSDDSPS
ncbi:hypothetical protein OPT61_g6772 [Boeremia exigua]|uniref:Uncharacterized protein n=1 Tax=Boeremia exigua TaxID=749465 RepID=A0ACC2I527_9PLEO|nr:hypothetical protein OPT61_g6772 [Boeremia exigua]